MRPRTICGGIFIALIGLLSGGWRNTPRPGGARNWAFLAPAAKAQTDAAISGNLDRHPLASLPAGIALVRVQAPGYRSDTAVGWGTGNYCIVTTRNVERPEQIERLAKMPMVSGIAPINRLLLSGSLNSDMELRQAAASLHADFLLIYTLDTTFTVDDKASPLTVLTLGLSPNQQARVLTTAAAVLMDMRNGYIYGVAEATESQNQLASAWTSANAVDETRCRTESAAFDKLVGELERTWMGVIGSFGTDGKSSGITVIAKEQSAQISALSPSSECRKTSTAIILALLSASASNCKW